MISYGIITQNWEHVAFKIWVAASRKAEHRNQHPSTMSMMYLKSQSLESDKGCMHDQTILILASLEYRHFRHSAIVVIQQLWTDKTINTIITYNRKIDFPTDILHIHSAHYIVNAICSNYTNKARILWLDTWANPLQCKQLTLALAGKNKHVWICAEQKLSFTLAYVIPKPKAKNYW